MLIAKRWMVLIGGVLAVCLGIAIWRIYTHPPLAVEGWSSCCKDGDNIQGLDFENRGRWPLRLTGVDIDGQTNLYQVDALVSNIGELASSAAWRSWCLTILARTFRPISA